MTGKNKKTTAEPKNIEAEEEEKFLQDAVNAYNFWNKKKSKKSKLYAEAYRTIINEFTKSEDNA